jgi:stearoyl-CoA desaturase (Delta-9 desaturase)
MANLKKETVSPVPRAIDSFNLVFLTALHVAAVGGTFFYLRERDLTWLHALWAAVGFVLSTLAISAGYHRLFSHRTYETGSALKAIWLFLGAAAFETSALEWSRKHRIHHQHTDSPKDPYDATRGLWYSHLGWILEKDQVQAVDVSDLEGDPLVYWQHRYYPLIAVFAGLLVPSLVGLFCGDLWGGLLFGGLWRIVATYQATFAINSLAHKWGKRPYSMQGTARDSWWTALVTMGEGYHNFHHTFPGDYRNGHRFYDFDPPKWLLSGLAFFGVVHSLKRTPGHLVALRRLRTDRKRLEQLPVSEEKKQHLRLQAERLRSSLSVWANAGVKMSRPRWSMRWASKRFAAVAAKRREFWIQYRVWRSQLKMLGVE